MNPEELQARTHEFARVILEFCTPLLQDWRNRDLVEQLRDAGTGVNANYGSAREARSRKEFIAKLGQVLDDASESQRWLRLFRDSKQFIDREHFPWLLQESEELTRIFSKSYHTARTNHERREAERKMNGRRRKRNRRDADETRK